MNEPLRGASEPLRGTRRVEPTLETRSIGGKLDVRRDGAGGGAVSPPPPPPEPKPRKRAVSVVARGEPLVWLTGGGLALALSMIVALLGLVLVQGFSTFWPKPIQLATLSDGSKTLGEVTRSDRYQPTAEQQATYSTEARETLAKSDGWTGRDLVRVGNFDIYGEDFRWIPAPLVVKLEAPPDAWMVERLEWGPWIGHILELRTDGQAFARGAEVPAAIDAALDSATERRLEIRRLEKEGLGRINSEIEEIRLEKHGLEGMGKTAGSEIGELDSRSQQLSASFATLQKRIQELKALDARTTVVLDEIGGQTKELSLSQLVRAYPANQLGLWDKLEVYASRWLEFLTEEPREANTEGGVMPAIFGTLMMTVIMSLIVAPFGVICALYLREYAKQGWLVSIVRIAVNNLAGVPSIVFGVFGLGFFCYTVGGTIDSVFFPERLPSPTFGTGGLIWASLTLALLTVPVVIVATEEALAAVPRSMREGSYACGASRWQTVRRVVLPRAAGGILTGLILAMARGAGEVAPLMLTGVVKLAPELPVDGHFPYLHLERSFMHLGFHIYDVGFQSRNAEAAKPMVFTTTLLLILLVLVLNLAAIRLRRRLRQRFKSAQF